VRVALAFSEVPTYVNLDKGRPGHIEPGPLNQAQMARLWFDWVAELGGAEKHELVLLVPEGTSLPESVGAWKKLIRLNDRHQISTWPQGPNAMMKQLIWWMTLRKISEPIFWMESDAIPLKPYWIDAWADEYARAKKPFMGAHVPEVKGFCPPHMSGIGVYPPNAAELAPKILQAVHTAWDVWSAPEILPQMHATKLLQHAWQHPPITTMAEYNKEIDREANIFHTDKFGALIELFRSQRSGQVKEPEAGQIIRKAFGTEEFSVTKEVTNPASLIPAAMTEDDVFRLVLDVIKTEKQRTRLVEFLRDHNYFFLNFGKGRRSREPLALAKHHGRA
jgi:hypothetical protein